MPIIGSAGCLVLLEIDVTNLKQRVQIVTNEVMDIKMNGHR